MKFKTFSTGGIRLCEYKMTAENTTVEANIPDVALFPLSQHIGVPAVPIVKRGDKVKVGTKIAEAGGFVSAPIYSSVSGTVVKIDSFFDATGYQKPAIAIKSEGDDWEDDIDRSSAIETLSGHCELTPEFVIERIKEAGITGMGGAGFPTFIKLSPPKGLKAECLVINGVECEPYITSDYRLMMEHPDEIIVGVELLMFAAKVEKCYIGIEINKLKAIKLFNEKLKDKPYIKVVALKQKYPQGGEKQLVDAVIGREVPPPPAIPVNVGAIVQNVGTAFAVYQAVMKRKPLIDRYTTITGKRLPHPQNFLARLGTPVKQLIEACGSLPDDDCKIIAGGPMMGKAIVSVDVPICKGTNCITILSGGEALREKPSPCIRCAKCVDVCPMGLQPYLLAVLSSKRNWENAERLGVVNCIECGSCQYTCPAHRPLLDNIRQGKAAVLGIIKSRKSK